MALRESLGGIRQLLEPPAMYRRSIASILSAALLVQVLALVSPLLSQMIVDHAAGLAIHGDAFYIVFGYGLVLMTAAIAECIRSLWVNAVLARLEADAHPQAYSVVFGSFSRDALQLNTSEVISRFQSLRTAHQGVGNILVEGVVDSLYVVTILAALVVYDSLIASAAASAVMIYFAARLLVGRRLTKVTREIAQADASQVAYLKDEVDAHQSVRLFDAHLGRRADWNDLVTRRLRKEAERARTTALLRCIQQFSIGAISVITIAVGAHRVGIGELPLGAMFALIGLTYAMFTRMTVLTERLSSLDVLNVHWRRFRELAHRPSQPRRALVRLCDPDAGWQPGLHIHDLRVAFAGRTVLDLKPVVFPRGKLTVIVGRSGEGKTTLVRAITGLVPCESLEMSCVAQAADTDTSLDSVWNEREWSRHCAACFQGDALFEGIPIAQNIACYDAALDMERVERAARSACIEADIVRLLGGYHAPTAVQKLSEGQAQRLLVARALYRAPLVLLLDEATSALDEHTESAIIENVKGLGVTVIAVAHRPQWIRAADAVLRLSNGSLRFVSPKEDTA